MNFEFHSAGHDVFEYGDNGDKFYLIIRGTASVKVPPNYRASVINETYRIKKEREKSNDSGE